MPGLRDGSSGTSFLGTAMRKLTLAVLALMLPASAMAEPVGHHSGAHHGEMHGKKKAGKSMDDCSCKSACAYNDAMDKMHKGMMITYTGNADIDFARGMVPHHQGAVDMVEVLHKYGKDEELRELGKNITIWQNQEIALMTRWLETRGNAKLPEASKDNAVARAYKQTMDDMHKGMDITYTGDADYDFVKGMIPHHQGAIDMAWVLVKNGRDPLLQDIAQDVIRSQQQEIRLMQGWLERHPQPEPKAKPMHKKKHKGKSKHGHHSH